MEYYQLVNGRAIHTEARRQFFHPSSDSMPISAIFTVAQERGALGTFPDVRRGAEVSAAVAGLRSHFGTSVHVLCVSLSPLSPLG
jgi:hypothetical protein